MLKNFLKKIYLLILDRGEGKEKEREKHQCVVASHEPLSRDLSYNPDMCSDWESKQWPFCLLYTSDAADETSTV